MKKISKDIKNKILTYEDIPERINALKDTYKGEKCYIIGAGPSLKNYTQDYLKEKLKLKSSKELFQGFNGDIQEPIHLILESGLKNL